MRFDRIDLLRDFMHGHVLPSRHLRHHGGAMVVDEKVRQRNLECRWEIRGIETSAAIAMWRSFVRNWGVVPNNVHAYVCWIYGWLAPDLA